MRTEYHVYEVMGPVNKDGYIDRSTPGQLLPRSIHESSYRAEEEAAEYRSWEWERDMELGDKMPQAMIFEVEVDE